MRVSKSAERCALNLAGARLSPMVGVAVSFAFGLGVAPPPTHASHPRTSALVRCFRASFGAVARYIYIYKVTPAPSLIFARRARWCYAHHLRHDEPPAIGRFLRTRTQLTCMEAFKSRLSSDAPGEQQVTATMRHVVADSHTASNTPDLFRPPKLSGAGPG